MLSYQGINGTIHDTIQSLMPQSVPEQTDTTIPTVDNSDLPYGFHLTFFDDQQYIELLALKRSIFLSGIFTMVIIILLMWLFLRHQLDPYSTIIDSILDYAEKDSKLEDLRLRLESVQAKPFHESTRIAEALIRMVDTLKNNFNRIEEYNRHLEELASIDALTELKNRGSTDKTLIAEILTNTKRFNDWTGRWGGEEFLILCPGTSGQDACEYAEKLRKKIATMVFTNYLRITASFGVTAYHKNEPEHTLIDMADKALYNAKNAGRNNVKTLP